MITWRQALAWRMRRLLLDPPGEESVAGVVSRLGATPATPEASAELAVGVRRTTHRSGDVARALASGAVFKAYAFRGATHQMTPDLGSCYLALRASTRMWERSSWVSHYDLTPADWPDLRACVRDALAGGPLTRAELADAVARTKRFAHLHESILHGNDTLMKPMSWQGDLCFGPPQGGRITFQSLTEVTDWPGLPDLDDAGRRAIQAYVRAYGPATPGHLGYWLTEGLGVRRKLVSSWVSDLGDCLVELDVEGEPRLVHRDDVEELRATDPSTAVRLLPAYDQWVLGPGTADPHVVPAAHRPLVSGGAALVVSGGAVVGTWTQRGQVAVSLLPDADAPDAELLQAEVERVSALLSGS